MPPTPSETKLPPPAALREFMAALPEPALLAPEGGTGAGVEIAAANAALGALTGYDPTELAGRDTRLLHGPRTNLLLFAAPGVPPPAAGENWLHRRDGTEFYASWRFAPVLPGWQIGIFRDATETKRLQEAVLHSEKLSTVGMLAGSVAHDFKNLLSVINGYCEILRDKLEAVPSARKDLQEIHRAGQKAAGLARQLLEFSRREENESNVVNANTLIREIAEILRRAAGESVTVELRLASDLGNMRVGPTQFQQALLNLCFNARDAMPAGGKLTVRTFRADFARKGEPPPGLSARSYAVTQVRDTGQGMEEQVRRQTFQPFFTTKPHGTGLGLSTVRGIVRRAGGEALCQSEPGRGTVFELYLPETAEAEQIFSTTFNALPATRGSEALWLVESDKVIRKMVTGILTADGYQVREFATPAEALAAPPFPGRLHLLLLEGKGKDVCRVALHLRQQHPKLKALFLATDAPAAVREEFPPRSVTALPKPFALSTLLRTVRELLDQ